MSECEKCRHVHQAGMREGKPAYVCRRYPPQLQFLIVPRPAGGQLMVQAQPQMIPVEEQRSGFPSVVGDWSCGEFVPKILS